MENNEARQNNVGCVSFKKSFRYESKLNKAYYIYALNESLDQFSKVK